MFLTVESIDPSYQPDAQNKRCALHAAAQRGLLDICYMLVQVKRQFDYIHPTFVGNALKAAPNPVRISVALTWGPGRVASRWDAGPPGLDLGTPAFKGDALK